MNNFDVLKKEIIETGSTGNIKIMDCLFADGVKSHYNEEFLLTKAKGIANIFTAHKKYIYKNDLILGSYRGCFESDVHPLRLETGNRIRTSFIKNNYRENVDHYAPHYDFVLQNGIKGLLNQIETSKEKYKTDSKKVIFLESAKITVEGLSDMILQYGEAAKKMGKETEAEICRKIAKDAPESFREALQLMWFIHLSFYYEGRIAMAWGRADQFLYPFYKKDFEKGDITEEEAVDLMCCTMFKMYELRQAVKPVGLGSLGIGDVVNICIGGVDRDGNDAVNDMSFIILEAVKRCEIPGPNLSARISEKSSDKFLEKCLEVISTGIGYPALMNDEVNIASLERCGYDIKDCRDYAMVGCIENFLPGKQPPWSDGGGINQIKCLELALNNGRCMQTDVMLGAETEPLETVDTMDKFIEIFKKQFSLLLAEGVVLYNNDNTRHDNDKTIQPYLSCFTTTCIERGLDIRQGGMEYPRVHGFGFKGYATLVDSLAAIEKVVFEEKLITLTQLRDILKADFEGYEDIRQKLLKAPKFGNNDDFVDKYAKMIIDLQYDEISKYRTPDGGMFYTAIASNVFNIKFGEETAATPDGRKNGTPLSDAASPMRGMDKNGLTSAILSVSKPDYSKCACGTVYNIKLTEDMFKEEEKRKRLIYAIRTYFSCGGQEMQFNCVSRKTLEKAMDHPEEFEDLVVRVSGFSAFYTTLDRRVQKDILSRTEHS